MSLEINFLDYELEQIVPEGQTKEERQFGLVQYDPEEITLLFYDPDKKVYIQNSVVIDDLKKDGYVIEKDELVEIDGIKYILFYAYIKDEKSNRTNYLIGYIHPHMQLAYEIKVSNQQNEYDLEVLKMIGKILKEAKHNGSTESYRYVTYDFK